MIKSVFFGGAKNNIKAAISQNYLLTARATLLFLFTPLRFPLIIHLAIVRILHDLRADDSLFALRSVACGLAAEKCLDLSSGKLHAVHFCNIHSALALAVIAEFALYNLSTAFRASSGRLMAVRKCNRLIRRAVFPAHFSHKLLNAGHKDRFGQAAVFDLL